MAFNSSGHCYFIEDGNEEHNVFDHNLGIHARPHTLLTSDAEPSIFWITHPFNHFFNNAAVGSFLIVFSLVVLTSALMLLTPAWAAVPSCLKS